MNLDYGRLERIIDSLPPISPSVNRVIELANQMNTSPVELTEAIKIDPVLTTKVLKLINSAYFGMRQEVTSLNRAIILLGINTIKNLALSTALLSTFGAKKSKSGFELEKLWYHSVAVGVASKILGREIGVEKKYLETYFIAGLIHDIGKLLFDQYQPTTYKMIIEKIYKRGGYFYKEEKKLFTYDHGNLGSILCRKWKLGDNLVNVVELHHSEEQNRDQLTVAVRLADVYLNRIGEPYGMIGGNDVYNETDFKKIGLNEEKLNRIFQGLNEEFEKATIFIKGVENAG